MLARAPPLLLLAIVTLLENSDVNPCVVLKLRVGAVELASFCMTMDTAMSPGVTVVSPVGVNVLVPVLETDVVSVTSNGVAELTLRKPAIWKVQPSEAVTPDGMLTLTLLPVV